MSKEIQTTTILDRRVITTTLISWGVMFKSSGYSMDEIRHLTDKYYHAFADARFTPIRFQKAAAKAETMTTFFPTIKDIFDADKEIQQRSFNQEETDHNNRKTYEKHWKRTDAETEHGRAQLKNIFDILEGKVTPAEGERRSWALLKRLQGGQ